MNTKITMNQKMVVVILGLAVFAIAGVSVASAQTGGSTNQTNTPPQIQGSINAEQLLLSNVKTNFSDAANTAAAAVTNGRVIGGSLTEAQGYLVYAFKVIDDKNMAYSVIVDPANGKVLYTSTGHPFHMGGFGMGHGAMMKRGHMGAWNSQKIPTTGTNTPSAITSDIAPSGLQT